MLNQSAPIDSHEDSFPSQARWSCLGITFSMVKEMAEWMSGTSIPVADEDIADCKLFRNAFSVSGASSSDTSLDAIETEPTHVQRAWLRSAKCLALEAEHLQAKFSIPTTTNYPISKAHTAAMLGTGSFRTSLALFPLGPINHATSVDNVVNEQVLLEVRALGTAGTHTHHIRGSLLESASVLEGPPCLPDLPVYRSPSTASGCRPSPMDEALGIHARFPHLPQSVKRNGIGTQFPDRVNVELSTMQYVRKDTPPHTDRYITHPMAAKSGGKDHWDRFRPDAFTLVRDHLTAFFLYNLFFPSERLANLARSKDLAKRHSFDGCITYSISFDRYRRSVLEKMPSTRDLVEGGPVILNGTFGLSMKQGHLAVSIV